MHFQKSLQLSILSESFLKIRLIFLFLLALIIVFPLIILNGCEGTNSLDVYTSTNCEEYQEIMSFDRIMADSSLFIIPVTAHVIQKMTYNPGSDCESTEIAETKVAFTNLLSEPILSFHYDINFKRYSVSWEYSDNIEGLEPGHTSEPIKVSTRPTKLHEDFTVIQFSNEPVYSGGSGLEEELIGIWTGTYSWRCGGGGETDIEVSINNIEGNSFTGTATYLGGVTSIEGTDGFVIYIKIEESSSNVHNTFYGVENNFTISGSTLNGDGTNFLGGHGCSGGIPSGSFQITRQ